jgi:chromosome segregation ATPase
MAKETKELLDLQMLRDGRDSLAGVLNFVDAAIGAQGTIAYAEELDRKNKELSGKIADKEAKLEFLDRQIETKQAELNGVEEKMQKVQTDYEAFRTLINA